MYDYGRSNKKFIFRKTLIIILVLYLGFAFFTLFTGAGDPNQNQGHNGDSSVNFPENNNLQESADKIDYNKERISIPKLLNNLLHNTGIYQFIHGKEQSEHSDQVVMGWKNFVMILISLFILYLGIFKEFEPLLLIPIGFGGLLTNVPLADIAGINGFLGIIFNTGVANSLFPILIFMGVGAMTDFGPLIANPKTFLLGAAAQLGIFATLIGASLLNAIPSIQFSFQQACAIAIIGGADGPTSIFVSSRLAPDLLGAIAVSAYSYMALVPIIQPPIMKLLTTKKERMIKMEQLREVSRLEKILFPLIVLLVSILLLPSAVPLIGALTFGNLIRESKVAERLSKTLQNEMVNIVTILLGLSVGTKLSADKFLNPNTLGILILGLLAFSIGTFGGVLFGKIMGKFSKKPLNPLIGAAGVSAVPMAARVVNKVGLEEDQANYLLMHAMGPNVAGVIGSAIAAGILLALF